MQVGDNGVIDRLWCSRVQGVDCVKVDVGIDTAMKFGGTLVDLFKDHGFAGTVDRDSRMKMDFIPLWSDGLHETEGSNVVVDIFAKGICEEEDCNL